MDTQQETTLKNEKLSRILTEMKSARQTANLELHDWPRESRPGMEVAREQARTSLKVLAEEYRQEIMNNAAVILVVGSPEKCKKFEEEGRVKGVVVVDSADLYTSIAQSVFARIEQDKTLLAGAILELESQIMQASSLFGVNGSLAKVDARYYNAKVNEASDLIPIIRETVRTSTLDFVPPIGDTVSVCYAQELFLRRCEDLAFDELPVAVMVSRLAPEELQAYQKNFAPGRPFTVINTDDSGSAEKALNKASKDLAKKLGL